MKASELTSSMAFSHRPQDGISVGITVVAGVAYMAVGFVRDGDQFNRGLARRILSQRISSTVFEGKNVKFVAIAEHLPEKVDARALIREFRKLFKPDPLCQDATFVTIGRFGSISTRAPMPRDEQWAKILGMFDEAVKAASTQCVS